MDLTPRRLFLAMLRTTLDSLELAGGGEFPRFAPDEARRSLEIGLNEDPLPPDRLLAEFKSLVLDGSINKTHPGYFAFVDTANVATNLLASPFLELFSQNQIVAETDAPKTTFLELKLLHWLRYLIGWEAEDRAMPAGPREACGLFCSSGCTANLLGLLAARSRALPELREQGMRAVPWRTVVFVPDTYHYSMKNAAWVLGLGASSVTEIATDSAYRMKPQALRHALDQARYDPCCKVVAVMALAGNSYTMAIDPLAEVAELCREHDVFLHVDACNGGAALFSRRLRPAVEFLRLADTVAIDPHKNLGVTYPSSLVLFRRQEDFARIQSEYGNIVNDPHSFDLGTMHPVEGSRGAHSLKLWLLIRYYGLRGIADRVEANHDNALYFHHRLRQSACLRPLHEPTLFNQAFSVWPAGEGAIDSTCLSKLNQEVHQSVRRERRFFIHKYRLPLRHAAVRADERQTFVLCAMFGNQTAAASHIDALAGDLERLASDALARQGPQEEMRRCGMAGG